MDPHGGEHIALLKARRVRTVKPFPRAHWYVIAFPVVTVIAFYPSYFGNRSDAPPGHHMHGITATLWMLFLIWQGWAIHNKRREQHALAGKASFVIMPFFLVAGLWVTQMTIVKEDMFKEMFGLRLSPADWGAVFHVALVYALAPRHRHKVHVHARYMLVTIVPLHAPSIVRLFTGMVLDIVAGWWGWTRGVRKASTPPPMPVHRSVAGWKSCGGCGRPRWSQQITSRFAELFSRVQ